jgi:hypothetical protein
MMAKGSDTSRILLYLAAFSALAPAAAAAYSARAILKVFADMKTTGSGGIASLVGGFSDASQPMRL